MPFRDFAEIREPLRLPYRGKVYEVQPVGLLDAPRLWEALEKPAEVDLTPAELRTILLGDTFEAMRADNVPPELVLRAEMTALGDFRAGRETAEFLWETGADPKVLAAWAASRMTPASPTSATAAETSTPTPASGTGTKTSQTSPEAARKRSAGPRSSTSGSSSKATSRATSGSTSRTSSRAARGGGSASA